MGCWDAMEQGMPGHKASGYRTDLSHPQCLLALAKDFHILEPHFALEGCFDSDNYFCFTNEGTAVQTSYVIY